MKIRSNGTQRCQPVRTEDAPNLVGGLVDIGGGDTAKSAKPYGRRKVPAWSCFRNDGACHL
jgi:hypothetical protein